MTSLHLAAAIQNEVTFFVVEALLNNEAIVNKRNQPEMDTPLILAVRHLDTPDVEDVVLLLLKKKADVGCRNKVNYPPGLSRAVKIKYIFYQSGTSI